MKQHKKHQPKCHDQQKRKNDSLEEGPQYADKHHHVEAYQRKFISEQSQHNPAEEDGDCSKFPLAIYDTEARGVEYPHKVQRGKAESQLQPIGELLEVVYELTQKLK